MKRLVFSAAALLAAALAAPVAAQSSASSGIPEEMQEAYRDHCDPDIPSFDIEIPIPESDGDAALNARTSFDTSDPFAIVAVCIDEYGIGAATEIRSISEALSFMALREAEALWPMAEAKWGNDLGTLRADLRRAALMRKSSTAYATLMRGRTDSVRAMAYDLANIGYYDEATTALDEEAARLNTGRIARNRRFDFERVMVAIARATVVSKAQGDAAGAAVLKAFLASTPATNTHLLNAKINMAALLAESGQHHEALSVIEPAYQEFRGFQEDSSGYKIGGSDREFAWILACSNIALGNVQAATDYVAIVDTAQETPADRFLPRTKPSSMIKLRLAACTDNQEEYLNVLFGGTFARLSGAWADLQAPGGSFEFYSLGSWKLPEEREQQYLAKYRMLPESYSAALSGWTAPAPNGD